MQLCLIGSEPEREASRVLAPTTDPIVSRNQSTLSIARVPYWLVRTEGSSDRRGLNPLSPLFTYCGRRSGRVFGTMRRSPRPRDGVPGIRLGSSER